MEGSRRSFDQVKAILGKLDRSIDEARSRRLGVPSRDERPAPRPTPGAPSPLDQEVGGPRPAGEPTPEAARPATDPAASGTPVPRYPAPNRPRPSFGRARPLNPEQGESRPQAHSDGTPLGRWVGPNGLIG